MKLNALAALLMACLCVAAQPPRLRSMPPKGATALLSPKAVSVLPPLPPATNAMPLTASINLAWDVSPAADDELVTQYRLYYGTASGSYTNWVTVGAPTNTGRITGLNFRQKYFVAATAATADGTESDFSNEVSTTTPEEFFFVQSQVYFISTTGFYGITNNIMSASVLSPTNWIPVETFFGNGSLRFYHQTNIGAGQLFKVAPR